MKYTKLIHHIYLFTILIYTIDFYFCFFRPHNFRHTTHMGAIYNKIRYIFYFEVLIYHVSFTFIILLVKLLFIKYI